MDDIVKAGVGVIVLKDNLVLIGKRKGSHGAGIYAFPGGHIDFDDTSLAVCGEREVMEETGIVCRVFSPDRFREELFTTYGKMSEDGNAIYVTVYLVAEFVHGNVTNICGKQTVKPLEPDKCDVWEWVTLSQLSEIVTSQSQKAWIPVSQVIHYLQQIKKDM